MAGHALIDGADEHPAHGAAPALAWWRLSAAGRDLLAHSGMLAALEHVHGLRTDHRRAKRALAAVPPILANVAEVHPEVRPVRWHADAVLHTLSDVIVVTAGPPGQPFETLVMIADTPAAAEALEWQHDSLDALREDDRLGDWRALLPVVLDTGFVAGSRYLVERRIAGVGLDHTLATGTGDDALRDAAAAIHVLHDATAHQRLVGRAQLERWVRAPARVVATLADHARERHASVTAFARLADDLCAALAGRTVPLSWVHGDYAPANILTGCDGRVSGILDWEFAHPQDLPSLDIVTLLLTARMHRRRQELGRVVCDLLASPGWTETEAQLLGTTPDADDCAALGVERTVLLYWLRHAARMITRCTHCATSGLWVHTNVLTVLDLVADAPLSG